MNYDYLDKEQIINILNDTLECVDKQRKEIEELEVLVECLYNKVVLNEEQEELLNKVLFGSDKK